jgi:Protein of unknown function (DUF1236)
VTALSISITKNMPETDNPISLVVVRSLIATKTKVSDECSMNAELDALGVLPEQGVAYHEVPAEYHVTGYRYSYVNDHPVLVEPHATCGGDYRLESRIDELSANSGHHKNVFLSE